LSRATSTHIHVGQGVDDRGADAMQAAGGFVGLAGELAAGVQRGHDDFERGFAGEFRVRVDRDAAPVVATVTEPSARCSTSMRLAWPATASSMALSKNLGDQVVQRALVGAADIHARPLADRLQPFENLDGRGVVGPPTLTERSRMQIHALGLDYQMTAQQWLMQHMLLKGYNVQGIEIHGEKSAEALYVLIENAESYVVRSLAILNGKRVIFLEYYIPIDRWHDEKIVQEQVVKSFALKQNVEESVEPLEVYKFLDIAVVQYPVTWKLVAQPIKTIERMKIKMLNLGKSQGEYEVKTKLDGKIEVEMVSAFTSETLEQEIERYRTDLDKSGLAVQDFVEAPEDFVLNPHFDFAETNVYKAADSENKLIDYEFWQTVLSSGDYYYFVSLLTPARDQDYFIWSRNTETYKMILGLMKPQEETMTDDDSGGEILE
jgi:hypothetical protein